MGLDFLACCVFAYWFVKHLPELAGDMVSEWQHARRGEESPAAAARRARLAAAGVDPATGGAFRRYAGNVWRDFWTDQDQQRQAARARRDTTTPDGATAGAGQGWWGRLGDHLDDHVAKKAAQWKARRVDAEDMGLPLIDALFDESDPGPTPGQPTADDDEWMTPPFDDDIPGPGVVHDSDEYQTGTGSTPDPEPARAPIRVDATVGDPIPQPSGTTTAVLDRPIAIEGNPMSAVVTRGQAVTGVVSGAAEARSIQRALDAAAGAYAAAVAQARARIHSMGEQTLGTVQMAGQSTVVAACAQAAEAIAAAQSSVNICNAEVIPLLGRVAREFDKRNS